MLWQSAFILETISMDLSTGHVDKREVLRSAAAVCFILKGKSKVYGTLSLFFYIKYSQIIQYVFKHILFILVQIPPGFFLQQPQNIYGLFCYGEIFDLFTGRGIFNNAQVNENRCVQGEDKC